jgi:hypothetical protein
MLEPTITQLDKEGLLNSTKPYVYGYDEQGRGCESNIRALFGAIKKKWPAVVTVAVLNWPGGLPVDLPVDIWVLQYQEFVAEDAKRWKQAGKQQYWYGFALKLGFVDFNLVSVKISVLNRSICCIGTTASSPAKVI